MKTANYLRYCAISIALCSGMAAQAKSLIIVDANPPELYPKGSIVEDSALTLTQGQQLKVIAGDGKVLNLQAGTDGAVTETANNAEDALSVALAEINGGLSVGGAMRGRVPPKVWMANVESQGAYCSRNNSIKLWRANANQLTTLTMQRQGSEQTKEIKWAAGQATHEWHFNDGNSYLAKLDSGANTARRLTFHQLPGNVRFTPKRVVWMAKKGCIQQAQRLFPW